MVTNDPDFAKDPWPCGVDAVILPGLGHERQGDAVAPRAEDVKEELEAAGVRAAYWVGDGTSVILRESAAWWGPVIVVGVDWLQTHGVDFLADLFSRAIDRMDGSKATRAVVRVGRYRGPEVEVEWLDYDGPSGELPGALRAWAKRKK